MEAGPNWEGRLAEAKTSGLLNLSYLPPAALEEAIATALANPGVHVAELDVSSCGLEELPPLVASFSALRSLRAKYNRLARLPVELLAALPRLEAVDLEGNRVAVLEDGALQALGDRLRSLNLSGNGLAALPDGVGRCRALEALTLANNPLVQLPEALASCPALSHLDVSSCRLVALPAALAGSKSLQRFFCQNNDLARVPTALGHLPNLKEWNLRANRLPLKYEQARERGLAKFLAFLREEEIERLQEVERNRPVGVAAGPCMVYRCKAVLDDAVAAARQGQPTDGFAWIRQGWAAAQHRSCLYVFGGMVVKEDGRKTSELLVLDMDTMAWRVQPTRGDRPVPRDGHVFVADPASNQLLCFGGRSSSGRRMNDLHALDLATWTWYVPKQEGAALPPSREHAAAALAPDGRLLLFGGRTNGARLNDLWSWDSVSGLWEQLPVHGTAPTPRQGAAACFADGQLYIVGGASNFVLSDCLAYSFDTQEWRVLGTEGHSKAAARAGGHVITHMDGEIWMFGGRDALGAQVSYLLKLRPKAGGAWYEWVETEFAMQPNRSRIVLFDSFSRLCITQCGHQLHKLNVSPEQIERGSCVWDVVQLVPLSAVQEKAVRPEDLEGAHPKRERVKHATLIAAKLPRGFSSASPREEQLLAACAAFRQRWALAQGSAEGSAAPPRLEPCLTLPNECGVNKCVCTTLRRTALPHTELHDLEGIAQFVAEFFTAEPLEDPTRPPTHLVSPWSLLEWQAGDCFDLATLACSLLLGAGYNAFVAVGYATSKQLALCDQSHDECPFLEEYGVEAPPYGELPEAEASFEEAATAGAAEAAAAAAPAGMAAEAAAEGGAAPARQQEAPAAESAAAAEASRAGTPSTTGRRRTGSAPGSRPATSASAPRSRLATVAPDSGAAAAAAAPLDAAAAESDVGREAQQQGQAAEAGGEETPAPAPRRPKRHIHAFVLIKAGRREVPHPLLLNPTTGLLHSLDTAPCSGIECVWNDRNWWASLQTDGLGGGSSSGLAELALTDLTFSNPNCWLPLLVNKEDHQAEAATVTTALSMRSSKAESLLRSVVGDLRSSPALHRTSSNFTLLAVGPSKTPLPGAAPSTAFSPRSQALLGSTSAAMAAAGAGASAAPPGSGGKPPGSGLALHHLALGGRSGTPRLGNYAPTGELFDSSMAFLSPEETAAGQRSSLLPGMSTSALLPAPSLLQAPSGLGPAAAGGAAQHGAGAASSPPGMPPPAEMPLSWVPALAISRERLDMRCPRGQKVVQYRQARRELFARYGECGRWDGLVERLTTYEAASGAPLCVLELFARRRDGLERRLAHPAQRSVLTCYGSGAAECVKSVRVVRGPGVSRSMELTFHAENRADGLLRRQHGSSALEEWFLPGSRPDGLVHRTVKYGAAGAAHAAAAAEQSGASGAKGRLGQRGSVAHRRRSSVAPVWEQPQQPAALICDRFSQSKGQAVKQLGAAAAAEAAAAGPRVVRRCFDLAAGRLELVTRPAADGAAADGADADAAAGAAHVTHAYGMEGELLEGGEGAACPSPEQQLREYAALQAACRAAQAAARDAEEDSIALVVGLQRQEQKTALVTPHWDATRVKVEESDDMEAEGEEGEYDFLHHFLPHTGARDLTAAEAAAARQACLNAFDDRQAARLHLLRARLAEGGAELSRLRALLADELHHLADPDRVAAEEAAAAFRLRMVQRRVEEHAPGAAAKRRELEARLDGDKRLAVALAAEAEARR